MKKDVGGADEVEALANRVVLGILMGKKGNEAETALRSKAPQHALLLDSKERSELFDSAAAKYAPKVKS